MANKQPRKPATAKKKTGPISDTEWETIDMMIVNGENRNEISRVTGRAPVTISRRAVKLGHSFDGSKVKAATERKQVDNAAVRADIVTDLHVLIQETIEMAQSATLKTHVTHDGEVLRIPMPRPEFRDYSDLGKWLTSLATAIEKVSKIDADTKPKTGAIREFLRKQVDDRDKPAA